MKDPIERVRAYLTRSGSGDDAFFADVEAEASDYAADLRTRCLALPDPRMLDFFDYVYAEQTPIWPSRRPTSPSTWQPLRALSSAEELRQVEPAYGGGV